MGKIKKKTASKIGLWSAISMLIGSIIGIGIFFKNGNVFKINDFNSIAILVAWILSGIISLCAAFSFAEVGSSVGSNAGIGGWCQKLVGYRFGRFVKMTQPFFYFIILAFAISIFVSEAIFNIFNISETLHFSVVMIVGFLVFVLFLFLNFISLKASAKFAIVTTAMKFIPIAMIIIGGIIYGVMNPSNSLFVVENNSITQVGPFNFTTVLVSIPSILFAYDPFFGVGNLSNEMKNPQKNVPLTIIISMIIVTVFYLLVTISQILVGEGSVYGVFARMFENDANAASAVNIVISIFIFVSILGVLNSFCALILRSFQSIIDEKLVYNAPWFKNFNYTFMPHYSNPYKGAGLLALISLSVVFLIMFIPSAILNTDALIDGISNFPVTIFFGVYGTVILGGIVNRFTKKHDVNKVRGFMFVAPVAVVGCYLVSFFQLFYTFSIDAFSDPLGQMSWGLFSQNNFITQKWMGSVLFYIYLVAMGSFYFVNSHLTKKYMLSAERVFGGTNYY